MDRYVLDANALFEDFRFERNPGRLLLREARHRRIRLLVPQVVVDETVNLYREAVQEHMRLARRALRRLQGMQALEAADAGLAVDLDAAAAAYASELMAIFESAGAEVRPYPSISHEAVVARALARRRPFDGNGHNGYRDVLLWETLLEAADRASPIVLVSGDKSAIGSKPGELDPTLVEELESAGLDGAIRRIRRVTEFTDALPTIPTENLGLEHLLASGDNWRIIVGSIEEEAGDWHQDHTSLIGLPMEIEDLYIASVDDVRDVQVKTIQALEDDQLALDLEAWADMTFEAHVDPSIAYAYRGEDFELTNHDSGDSLTEGAVQRRVLYGDLGTLEPD